MQGNPDLVAQASTMLLWDLWQRVTRFLLTIQGEDYVGGVDKLIAEASELRALVPDEERLLSGQLPHDLAMLILGKLQVVRERSISQHGVETAEMVGETVFAVRGKYCGGTKTIRIELGELVNVDQKVSKSNKARIVRFQDLRTNVKFIRVLTDEKTLVWISLEDLIPF